MQEAALVSHAKASEGCDSAGSGVQLACRQALDANICRLSQQVLRPRRATDGRIMIPAPAARQHFDRLPDRIS